MAGGFLVTPLTKDKLNLVTKLTAGICTPDCSRVRLAGKIYCCAAQLCKYGCWEIQVAGNILLPDKHGASMQTE